jgi:periplasmic copper chaperone A
MIGRAAIRRAARRGSLPVLGCSLLLAACGASDGSGPEAAVEVREVIVASPTAGRPAAMYLPLVNRGSAPDTVTGVRMAAAERAELHLHRHEDGLMRMEAITELELPARGELRMRPGAHHVMLFGLDVGSEPGDTLEGAITLGRGGELPVLARVVSYEELAARLEHEASHGTPED